MWLQNYIVAKLKKLQKKRFLVRCDSNAAAAASWVLQFDTHHFLHNLTTTIMAWRKHNICFSLRFKENWAPRHVCYVIFSSARGPECEGNAAAAASWFLRLDTRHFCLCLTTQKLAWRKRNICFSLSFKEKRAARHVLFCVFWSALESDVWGHCGSCSFTSVTIWRTLVALVLDNTKAGVTQA